MLYIVQMSALDKKTFKVQKPYLYHEFTSRNHTDHSEKQNVWFKFLTVYAHAYVKFFQFDYAHASLRGNNMSS